MDTPEDIDDLINRGEVDIDMDNDEPNEPQKKAAPESPEKKKKKKKKDKEKRKRSPSPSSSEASEVDDKDVVDDGDGENPEAEPQTGDEESESGSESESEHVRDDKSGALHARLNFIDDMAVEEDENEEELGCKKKRKKKIEDHEYDTDHDLNQFESDGLADEDLGPEDYDTDAREDFKRKKEKKRNRESKSKKKKKKKRSKHSDSESEAESSSSSESDAEPKKKKKKTTTGPERVSDSQTRNALFNTGQKASTVQASSFEQYESTRGADDAPTSSAAAAATPGLKKKQEVKLRSPLKKPTRPRKEKGPPTGEQRVMGEIIATTQTGDCYEITHPGLSVQFILNTTTKRYNKTATTIEHLTTAVCYKQCHKEKTIKETDKHALFFAVKKDDILVDDKQMSEIWNTSQRVLPQKTYFAYANEALKYSNKRVEMVTDPETGKEHKIVQIYFTPRVFDSIFAEGRRGKWDPPNVRIHAETEELLEPPVYQKSAVKATPKKTTTAKLSKKPEKGSHDVTVMLQQKSAANLAARAVPAAAAAAVERKSEKPVMSMSMDMDDVIAQSSETSQYLFNNKAIFIMFKSIMEDYLSRVPTESAKRYFSLYETKLKECINSADSTEEASNVKLLIDVQRPTSVLIGCLPFLSKEFADMVKAKVGAK
jgi:hypothetical protein